MNLKYAGNVLKSKVREQLRRTGLVESIGIVLSKHPELSELYSEAHGGGDLKEITQKFKAFCTEHPEVKAEIADKARKNVYDLPEFEVKGAIEMMASSGILENDEQAKIDEVLARYAETNDVAVLREGTLELVEMQVAKL